MHYIQNGLREGRTDIDGLEYIASYGDLVAAFGANAAAGRAQFVQAGRAEGRERDTFDEVQYLADCMATFRRHSVTIRKRRRRTIFRTGSSRVEATLRSRPPPTSSWGEMAQPGSALALS